MTWRCVETSFFRSRKIQESSLVTLIQLGRKPCLGFPELTSRNSSKQKTQETVRQAFKCIYAVGVKQECLHRRKLDITEFQIQKKIFPGKDNFKNVINMEEAFLQLGSVSLSLSVCRDTQKSKFLTIIMVLEAIASRGLSFLCIIASGINSICQCAIPSKCCS